MANLMIAATVIHCGTSKTAFIENTLPDWVISFEQAWNFLHFEIVFSTLRSDL